jgi:hypothetical protein
LIAGALLAALATPAHAAFPGQNGKIAFTNGDNPSGVWTMNPDGTGQTFLRSGGEPAWSAGGTELLFTRGYDVLRMPASGSSETIALDGRIPQFTGYLYNQPTWSPTGQVAATFVEIVESDNPWYTIYGVAQEVSGENPSWRPDGVEIAYVRYPTYSVGGLHVVRPDGTGHRTLVGDHVRTLDPDFSPDGSKIAFGVANPDGLTGLYVIPTAGGTPTLLSPNDGSPAWSPDGTKIAFVSRRDGNEEIYTMNADGSNQTRITNDPASQREPSWQPIVPGYVRPKTASPVRVSLVPAFAACTTPNRQHGPPLAFGSCNPPDEESPELTVGTGMSGFVRYLSVPGNPANLTDEADIGMRLQISDVRVQGTSADYAGEVEGRATARLTDRGSGGPATAGNVFFPLHSPCTPTAAPDVGSTCSLNTTLDTLIPGAISEGHRTVLELTQIEVYDGGADGDTATQPNSAFLRQGVFVP